MKAEQVNKVFVPVALTLETQDEVDAMYAVLCTTQIAEAMQMGIAWNVLTPFVGDGADRVFLRIKGLLK